MDEIKLTDSVSVYKKKYNWEYPKSVFINRIDEIRKFKSHFQLKKNGVDIIDEKYFYFLFDCLEFQSINTFVLKCASEILQQPIKEWSIENWVYIVNNDPKDLELNNKISTGELPHKWHTHPTVFVDFQPIVTDFTFVFYVQMPNGLVGKEGNIGFKTSDNNETFILPEEGDIILFPGTLEHTPVGFTSNKDKDRLLIAGNLSLNPLQKFNKRNLL
jgi:hypothetical protein